MAEVFLMKSRKPKLSLFLFIDALGWEIKQKHPFFLNDLIQDSKPLETILGYSSACDPSIISGLTPSEHKLWNSYYYDPENSPFRWTGSLADLPDVISGHARIRHHLGKWIKKRCGFTGYYQLFNVPVKELHRFNYAEQKCIWEPGGLPQGKSIFDRLAEQHISFSVHDSRLSDHKRIQNLLNCIQTQSIEFAYCSLGRLDALMHAKGNQHADIEALMKWYDIQIRNLISFARENYDEVAWYLFTDHGMHKVTGTCDLISDIETLGLTWNKDYIAFYDSTMARFWFMNNEARFAISEYLETHESGRIVSDDDLRKYGIFFEDRQYGERSSRLSWETRPAKACMDSTRKIPTPKPRSVPTNPSPKRLQKSSTSISSCSRN
jgi:hypothetical protein